MSTNTSDYNFLNLEPFLNLKHNIYVGKVLSNAYSLFIANLAINYHGLLVVLVEDFNIAYDLQEQLITYIPHEYIDLIKIMQFPDWEILPFDNFSPHPEIISSRLTTLYKLPSVERGILIVPIITLMHKICPVEYVQRQVLLITVNNKLHFDNFKFNLEQAGYVRVPQVMNLGEYAIRGSIIDLFPLGSKLPYRIDLVDQKVDSIRTFNVDTQRTIAQIDHIKILPAQEYPFDESAIKKFRINWRIQFANQQDNSQIYKDVSNKFKTPGLEYYAPLFFDKMGSLFDYLPKNCLVVKNKNCFSAATQFYTQVKERFIKCQGSNYRPILKIEKLFFNVIEIFSLLKEFVQIICSQDPIDIKKSSENKFNLPISTLPIDINEIIKINLSSMPRRLFCVSSKGRREIFAQLVNKHYPDIKLQNIDYFEDFFNSNIDNGLIISQLENGFIFNANNINIAIIGEQDLFPNKTKIINKRSNKTLDPDLSIKYLMEINIGDPIVHVDHGIGRYLGLVQLDYGATLGEFLIIEYADHNKLYVPIINLNLVHRYSGADLANAPLHKLGGDKWQAEKRKAAKQIKDVAAQLLEIYAIRASKNRDKYILNEENYQKFVDLFIFTDTKDQATASQDIINDLTDDKPMDRVICGDVGFGKTEIAMRAAFIAIDNSKQVAILAPTTLLAQQHYQTLLDRFADFSINIELLSRFIDIKRQKSIINKISKGNCDIVVGTHRLLQKDLEFKNLGLLIIDEEHKFGVEQKEKLKKLRTNIDILSLTATPIPRTLNMTMSGIRDISIIATPPNNRLAVKTFVREYNLEIVKEAIMRELQRGGQVYYLYNKIENITQIAIKLQHLIPQATVQIAHGQMPKKQLEHVMIDFYHRKCNILVCTTIIENGIDIPNANTIIIERANCFGLSQLHQLRGRVGRSNHQAYAFCFIPNRYSITADAIKRLEALEALDTLGVGFTLATHDLEIRGSGELLGNEQSGNMQNIGFSLYMELLQNAIELLKQHKELDNLEETIVAANNIEIELPVPAFIPSNYISDIYTRLILYKKFTKAKSQEQLQELMQEIIDRFGMLPIEVSNLFVLNKLKLIYADLGVKRIKPIVSGYSIEFNENNKINVDQIVNLIKHKPKNFKLLSNYKLHCITDLKQEQPISFLENLLKFIT